MEFVNKNDGSALLIVVFIAALLAVMVSGMLVINTEEVQVMQNQIYAAEALATAEAGLNHAFSQIRNDDEWTGPIADEPFNGGSYDVTVTGTLPTLTVLSVGTTSRSYSAKVEADVTVDTSGSGNHTIRIDNLRINE